ncbi:MotA/TolQ/ExbB proton channel family protein [Candidatus Albibeggiatoa sp. nov. BB20]|uniref:MotA/TolQ/ExbB proton channel family protein n=1 Tax=Candidatus Albibeggiatoa sp. nov. BB20 TaxID=3162723 RepID=UPI00336597CC
MDWPELIQPIILDLHRFIEQFNTIGLSIFSILLLMSILTWYLMLRKTLQLFSINLRAWWFKRRFWSHLLEASRLNHHTHPYALVAQEGIRAALHHQQQSQSHHAETLCSQSEFISRAMQQSIQGSKAHLESGLSILATIGSTAPFIGLLGTVLGIYEALTQIGLSGQASLDTVATPIGEALIMTALGLAVAIPAVLAYNTLVRFNRRYFRQLEYFAHEVFTYLNTGARLG